MAPQHAALFYIFLLVVLCKTNGKRGFEIYLDNCNGTSNPEYIESFDCHINKTLQPSRGYFDATFQRDINTFRYSFDVLLTKKNNERYVLMNSTDNDGCAFLEEEVGSPLVKIFKHVLLKFGNLTTKCPIEKGYHLVIQDLILDAERFPPYVPEANFVLEVKMTVLNDFVFGFQVYGSAVQMSNKRWFG